MVGPKWQDFNGERLMAGLQWWEPTGRALVAVPQWQGPSGLSLAADPLREQFAGGICDVTLRALYGPEGPSPFKAPMVPMYRYTIRADLHIYVTVQGNMPVRSAHSFNLY